MVNVKTGFYRRKSLLFYIIYLLADGSQNYVQHIANYLAESVITFQISSISLVLVRISKYRQLKYV